MTKKSNCSAIVIERIFYVFGVELGVENFKSWISGSVWK